MGAASLCLVISAALSIRPDRSQFFRYESFTMDCAVPGNGTGWTVKRNTSSKSLVVCEDGWGRPNGSSCFNQRLYTSDTGLYWCESKWGECSNVLNITVNVGVVILESPALPVAAEDKVTLRCSYKERYAPRPSSDFNALFYKNGVVIGNSSDGTLILPRLSKADEGLYKCKHPTEGESPESFLAVRVGTQPAAADGGGGDGGLIPPVMSPMRVVCFILLFILYSIILVLCIYKYWKRARARDGEKKREPYQLGTE